MVDEPTNRVDNADLNSIKRHPLYWFEDGTMTLHLEGYLFRLHDSFILPHSQILVESAISPQKYIKLISENDDYETADTACVHIKTKERVNLEDFEVLLAHLYEKEPLTHNSPFKHVTSVLRASSPTQLDFPHLFTLGRSLFERHLPVEPLLLRPDVHPIYEGLPIATKLGFHSVRKSILYSLVTTHQFDEDSPEVHTEGPHIHTPSAPSQIQSHFPDTGPTSVTRYSDITRHEVNPSSISKDNPPSKVLLSPADEELCQRLLSQVIQHFTPLLYTPATGAHMPCTDAFADMWMTYVIQPSLEDDGVYKPLETLERIKNIDWSKGGICASCVADKRKEWSEEQETIWELMDKWVAAD